ncbi:protein Shroom1 [Lacerta agilis]|uniref:protein Shroom1 n=1 Tax=Lacerta agilis TaxID=80427 RepID=UPI0014192542|nr:protein Shroom1 [Lacerta agilis]
MSFVESEISRWNLRHVKRIADLLEPVASPSDANRFSLDKSISGIDQCLHIPGKADSAYSSFSGGSNIPECPVPFCYNEHDSLPLEQLSYMDSGYVRGIYNPSAINPAFRQMYEDKTVGKSSHYILENSDLGKPCGSTSAHGMPYQPSPPLARFSSPRPPSPPTRVDSYKTNRNVDPTHSGIWLDPGMQADVYIQDTDSPANYHNDYWLSRWEDESPITEEGDSLYPVSQHISRNTSSTISNTPLIFQEYLRSDSLVKTRNISCAQNSVCSYAFPEPMESKSSPSLHTSHNAVNDTQENKQYFYACSVHKPAFAADLPSCVAVSSTKKGQLHGVLHPFRVADRSGLGQDEYESRSNLKYTDSSLSNKAMLGMIESYEGNKKHIFSSEEGSRDVWQPLLNQQSRMQKPLPHGLDLTETPHWGVQETASALSYYTHDAETSASQPLNGLRKEKKNDMNSSPDLLVNPRQEEMLKPVCFPKHHFSKKTESQPPDDFASIKINRKTTPLLYYLSGGKNPSFMSHENWTQGGGGGGDDVALRSPRNNLPVSAEPIEIPRDTNPCMDNPGSNQEGQILGSPASSVDEKFKNDYREKLKVAQRKVLRETSFKRKDLQMSLPVRLKQTPSSRPSIQHLRSLSLSSTSEDSKLIPASKPLQSISNEEELKRPQAARIGGRKRATKEQKKISYSEPEKLNQLDDQKDQSISWRKQNARSRSDEINEQDTKIIRGKALENQGRSLSKAELKQIQHNALLDYMERKIGQRPAVGQSSAQQKPPLQPRTLNSKKFVEDSTSHPSASRKLRSMDGFCQFPVPGKIQEPPSSPPSLTSTTAATMTDRHSTSSPVFEMADEGSCASKCDSAKSLLHSGSVCSRSRGRSKSTPPPVQVFCSSTACPALSAQGHEYYPTHPNSPSKEKLEADLSDKTDALVVAKQSAGRRGESMGEPGTSEMARLSPLSQSTDQLHHLKRWHISSGLQTGKDWQGEKHANTLAHCEPASSGLRQPHVEGVGGQRGSNSTVHELKQPPTTNKVSHTFPGVSSVPLLSVGRLPSPNVPLEPLPSSPAPAEMDDEVFKESFGSGSDAASDLPPLQRESRSFIPSGRAPQPAPMPPASTEGKQVKEEPSTSFPVYEKEESGLGNSREDENSPENSHGADMALDFPAFKEQNSRLLKKELSDKSQLPSASGRTRWQQLEANNATHHSESRAYYCTALLDSQGHRNTSHPLADSSALQDEHDCNFPAQGTDLSLAQSISTEDQRCEDLAVEIIAKDKSLVDILTPHPTRKTALDLMEGLFPVNISMPGRSCRRKEGIQSVQEKDQRSSDCAADPSHGTQSFLEQSTDQILSKSRESLDDPDSITSKKRELISSIHLKLQALWLERELIESEAKGYAVHGKELESLVQDLCKPNEYERYMMFIGDLEKVVSLLLCLSSRLARVQNAMEKMDENTDAEEKQSLKERHRLLSRQREDAKDLKENLDRRERVVSGILSKYMTETQLQDYKHFVQEKTSLLIEQKDLEEQIKFLEEKLERLEKSIPT